MTPPGSRSTSQPRKVGYLSLYAEIGGGEVSLLNLMKNLDRARYTPLLLLPSDGPLAHQARAAGIRTVVIPFPVVPLYKLTNPGRLVAMWRSGRAIAQLLAAEDIALIQCSDLLGLFLLMPFLLNNPIPVIYSVIFFYEHSRAALFNAMAPLFVRRIVSPSRAVADDLRAKTAAINDMLAVCYNGVDTTRFRPLSPAERFAARARYGLPENKILVGCLGRYDLWKGHATLLEALEQLLPNESELHGVIAGGAFTGTIFPAVERYRTQIIERAQPLVERGRLSILEATEAPESLLGCFDLFVCPSDREPFGLVVLEAYAAGVPVIATTKVGALEVMEDFPFVFTAEPRDGEALAAAIIAARQSLPAAEERIAMHARMVKYNWKRYAEQLEGQYDAVVRDEEHTGH